MYISSDNANDFEIVTVRQGKPAIKSSSSTPNEKSADIVIQPVIDNNVESEIKEEGITPLDSNDEKNLRVTEISKSEIDEIVKKSIEESNRGRGTGSSTLTDKIAKIFTTPTDWRPILRKFLQKGIPTSFTDRSYQNPSRTSHVLNRFMPGDTEITEGKPKKTIAVAIDTSGSVFDPKFLNRFFSEVFKIIISQKLDVLLIMWTSNVYYTVLLTPRNVVQELAKAKQSSGGTHMSCVAQWLAKPENIAIRKKLSGIIYITDLGIESNPQVPPGLPVAIFGPEELLNCSKSRIQEMKGRGFTVATYV